LEARESFVGELEKILRAESKKCNNKPTEEQMNNGEHDVTLFLLNRGETEQAVVIKFIIQWLEEARQIDPRALFTRISNDFPSFISREFCPIPTLDFELETSR